MEEGDLPGFLGVLQLIRDPLNLFRLGVCAVQCDEPHILFGGFEGVVELTVHVEQFVEPLFPGVVIAERGIELHAGIEQRLIRRFKFLLEVLRPLRTVDVVSDEDDELVFEPGQHFGHLLRKLILHAVARTEIAEDRELQRSLPIRQWDDLGRSGRRNSGNLCENRMIRFERDRQRSGDDSCKNKCAEKRSHPERSYSGGRALSTKSTMMCAVSSSRISLSPIN